ERCLALARADEGGCRGPRHAGCTGDVAWTGVAVCLVYPPVKGLMRAPKNLREVLTEAEALTRLLERPLPPAEAGRPTDPRQAERAPGVADLSPDPRPDLPHHRP